ncbi:MAG: hypothetical protein JWN44_62 [Myxococcales bacterium]|nr:hypothetical protein [Myxococcales bacterium]
MSAKKTCVGCGKQIPDTAVVCVFCSAKQPSSDPELAEGAVDVAAAQAAIVSKHATDPTLLGLKASDVEAALSEKTADSRQPTADRPGNGASATHPTATMQVVTLDTPSVETDAIPEPTVEPPVHAVGRQLSAVGSGDEPWGALGRLVMGIGGGVLVALFFCPWHGVSSWQLLETLSGADFVRQLFYLTGGIVLLAAALLPLPFVFRAAVGASVAAMPVVLGAAGVIDGWRGLVAALAILGLPATHLLRSRAQSSPAARSLVLAAVASVALLYILPVSSVVPIAAVFKMMGSGLGYAVFGVYVLIPLVFAGLSLLGVLGRDFTEVGVLLSVLILLWAPVGIALRGMMMDDGTQLYVAVALLWASATAALSLAQLLSLAATRPRAS